MTDVGHADVSIQLARELLEHQAPSMMGLWPRATAFLARQALEDAMSWIWLTRSPGLEECSLRAQLLCLGSYLGDEELGEKAAYVYSRLSWACHQHQYDLAPTAEELRGWVGEVEALIAAARSASMRV